MKEVGMATTQDVRQSMDEVDAGVRHRVAVVGDAVSTAAGSAATTAGDAMAQLPSAAGTTWTALVDANSRIRTGSDEMLIVGGALSLGFAMGLLFGGANRLLVAAAMVPAASMGLTILQRANQGWLERSHPPKR
jgi:hypothetical protein